MKYKVKEIMDFIEDWAKDEYQLSWDNSGKQIYFEDNTESVVLGMDLTDELIDMAIKNKSKLIITHHPLFFEGVKNICENTYVGDNIIKLIDNRISVLSVHTSLDIATGGVNDSLFKRLGLRNREVLTYEEEKPMGLVGTLDSEMNFNDFVEFIKDTLDVKNIRSYGKKPSNIKKVSLMGGSGAEFIDVARSCSDIFVTADVKYHDGQRAYESDFAVLDLGHFHSEKVVLDEIKSRLKNQFKDLEIEINKNSTFELD